MNQFFCKPFCFHSLLRLHRIHTYLSPTSHFLSSNKTPLSQSNLSFTTVDNHEELPSLKPPEEPDEEDICNRIISINPSSITPKVHISHPWSEWTDLLEHISKKGYFGGCNGLPFGQEDLGIKDTNLIRTSLLNFARDRFDIIRHFSKTDIAVVLGSGCPSLDRKVVNSGKRLRAHVSIEEGKVCSCCSLRGNCERAYVKAREDEGGRTVDVMRILLTYGLDPFTGSVENSPSRNIKVKESVRRLLSEMVEFSARELVSDYPNADPSTRHSSTQERPFKQQKGQRDVPMKQGDWLCPKCNFHNFAKNIKCLQCNELFQERLRKLGEDQEHLPLKKGDWICGKCNFLNFAKNTRCLQCKENPPKRQLIPGEWECPSCNYINFRRNMLCLKCDWKRPKASNYSDITAQNRAEYESSNQPHSMSFVREDGYDDQPSLRRKQKLESERSWTNLDEDKDDDQKELRPWNGFKDFPVAQGKSDASQNLQAREIWKKTMSKRGSRFGKDNASDEDLEFSSPSDFDESTDDDEIAEWFGGKQRD